MIIVPSMRGILGGGSAAGAVKSRQWPFAPFRPPVTNAPAVGPVGGLGTATAVDAPLLLSTFNVPSDVFDAPLDLVSRSRGARSATSFTMAAEGPLSPAGVVGKYASASSTWANLPLDLSSYNKIALSFWLYWDAYASNSATCCEYGPLVTNSGQNAFWVVPNGTSSQFQLYMTRNGGVNVATLTLSPRPSAAAWHHYVFNMDRTVSTAPGCFPTTFVDGVPQSISSNNAGTQSGNFTNSTTLHFMSRADSTLFGSGRLAYFNIFNGNLSFGAAQALYNTPWAMLRRRLDWT